MAGNGFYYLTGFLSSDGVAELIRIYENIVMEAPLVRPTMPNGTPFRLRLTNAGVGWYSDRKGYRYTDTHPVTGKKWPAIDPQMLEFGRLALKAAGLPEVTFDNLLINYYDEDGSLGQHVDDSEQDRKHPIVSFSVGADATFLLGGPDRSDKTKQYVLYSGDACIQAPPSRSWFHGIKEILPTMSNPIKRGRLNFTLRRAHA